MRDGSRNVRWAYNAHPAILCETGRIFYYTDETGVLSRRMCGAQGPVDDGAPSISTPEWPLLALDRNGDKNLGLDEIVEADVLAIARELAAESELPAGPAIGADRDLAEVLSRYRSAMEAKLLLGAGDESESVSLPIQGFSGDASKWLQTAPQLPIGMLSDQSTRALRELTNLAVAENLAVLRTGTCTKDLRSLWTIASALRIPGDRCGYDYGVARRSVSTRADR